MKYFILSALCVFLLLITSVDVVADEESANSIGITIVVPRSSDNAPQLMEATISAPSQLFPVHVWENREQGRREIIRVYNLRENEDPANIPREPFERDGFRFELGEIVRNETPVLSTKEHTEVIEVNTQSNDLESVIRLLSNTLEYLSDDGYFGVLTLDASGIKIESQGTRSSSRTASRTREFPHLSSADTALVPTSITDGGLTYSLANVEWRTQSVTTVDYTQLPSTYTAVATYTRTATSVSDIGYTTTAEYRGSVSRIATGRTEFTAHFIGIPIVTPMLRSACDTEIAGTTMHVEQVHIGGITIETQSDYNGNEELGSVRNTDANSASAETAKNNRSGRIPLPLTILLIIIFSAIAFCVGKFGKALLCIIRKPVSLCLCILIMLSISQVVYAAQIPDYGFGQRNNEGAVHLDTRIFAQGTANGHRHFDSFLYSADKANSMRNGLAERHPKTWNSRFWAILPRQTRPILN
jgi:hypothetical protein